MTKQIELTQGRFAIVDNKDFDALARFRWSARLSRHTYYATRTIWRGVRCTTEIMHRVILGAPVGVEVDHKNGNGLDNRRRNLRLATRAENQHNSRSRGGASRYKGVSQIKGAHKWRAQIVVDSRHIHLGYFDNEKSAAQAYDNAAHKFFGEFARENEVMK